MQKAVQGVCKLSSFLFASPVYRAEFAPLRIRGKVDFYPRYNL